MSDLDKINEQIKIFSNKVEFLKKSGNAQAHKYQTMVNKLKVQKEIEEKNRANDEKRKKLRDEIDELRETKEKLQQNHRILKESIENFEKSKREFIQNSEELFKTAQNL